MSRSPFRPRLEPLDERVLPSATLSINDVAHVNHVGGQTAYEFTVSLSQPSKQPVSVNYATADGTATAAEGDYVPTAGTLKFARGQTSQTITVLVNGTNVAEADETFLVRLSKPNRAIVADGTGVGTILEPVPTAAIDGTRTYQARVATGNVLANDSDPAGGGLTVGTVNGSAANVGTTIQLASGALLTVNADGSYTYDPNGAFDSLASGQSATDGFTYTATDALGTPTNTATVTITVQTLMALNDYALTANKWSSVGGNVLANDTDPASGGLTVGTVNGSAANVGTTIQLASGALLTVNADGSYTYDPNEAFDYLGTNSGSKAYDSFTYTMTDSLGNVSNTATVAIYIPASEGGICYGCEYW